MKIINNEKLRELSTLDYPLDNFCGVYSQKNSFFLTTDKYTQDFLIKNNVTSCIDLKNLNFPNGLGGNQDKRAFLGLAVGARAIKEASKKCNEEGNLIIHCKKGKERTPSAVAYYLIRYEGFEGKQAVELVRDALGCRKNADIFETSSSLSHYYQWLNKQSADSLLEYENRTTRLTNDNDHETLSDVLPSLYDIIEDGKSHVEIFKVKETKFLNSVNKQLKEVKLQSEVVDKKEDAHLISNEKLDQDMKKEKQPEEKAKSQSSTKGILGALSQRRSARLKTKPDDKKTLEGTYVSKASGKVRFSSPPSKSVKKKEHQIDAQDEKKQPKETLSSSEKEKEHEEVNATKPRFGM